MGNYPQHSTSICARFTHPPLPQYLTLHPRQLCQRLHLESPRSAPHLRRLLRRRGLRCGVLPGARGRQRGHGRLHAVAGLLQRAAWMEWSRCPGRLVGGVEGFVRVCPPSRFESGEVDGYE